MAYDLRLISAPTHHRRKNRTTTMFTSASVVFSSRGEEETCDFRPRCDGAAADTRFVF